ncbi:type IV toxin-antitoxin system AbiEi family antitoxin domain-containing protein [Candidatus Micrarchaeota archaeon]|nr:type IV toxin-antitoxin system AbiEi family antitoxin domain-containing protein [Candidatus Micrarchaeota archaeon]
MTFLKQITIKRPSFLIVCMSKVSKTVTFDYKNKKGLSAGEARIISDLAASGKQIVSLSDFLEKTGSSARNRVMVSRLAKKGWLIRLTRGKYLISPLASGSKGRWTTHEFLIASCFAKEYYIGFMNALNFYGFTEQVPMDVTIAVRKPLKNREVLGIKFNFVLLPKKRFFGVSKVNISGININISDKEKTIIDALSHPEHCGGIMEVAKVVYNSKKHVDLAKLCRYAAQNGKKSVFNRLGYLLDLFGILESSSVAHIIERNISKGYVALSPGESRAGKYNSRWRVFANVLPERLLSVRE